MNKKCVSFYNPNGNLTNMIDSIGITRQTLDNMNRLNSTYQDFSYVDFEVGYEFDQAGRSLGYKYTKGSSNMICRTIERNAVGMKMEETIWNGLEPHPVNPTVQQRTHNAADQITQLAIKETPDAASWSNAVCRFDHNGNITSDCFGASYSYDYENRLTSYNGLGIQYDGLGIMTIVDSREQVYDRSGAIPRILNSVVFSSSIEFTHVWGPNGMICQYYGTNQSCQTYLTDEQGSIIAVADVNGDLGGELSYSPYGEFMNYEEGPGNWSGSWYYYMGSLGVRFVGDMNLLHMNARYYNVRLKRFLTPDPIGLSGGPNLYWYANANPVYYVDPSGTIIETAWDVASASIGVYSLQDNIRKGNWGWAALDAVGVAVDGVAIAVPFIPGGVGAGVKALRAGAKVTDAIQAGNDVRKVATKTHKVAKTMDALADGAKGWEHAAAGTRLHKTVGNAVGDSMGYFDNFIAGANKSTGIRPDLDGGGKIWADITKSGSWNRHVAKYADDFGEGIPIFYELGEGVVNMKHTPFSFGGVSSYGAQQLNSGFGGASYGAQQFNSGSSGRIQK